LRAFAPTILADAVRRRGWRSNAIDPASTLVESLSQAQRDRTMVLVLGPKMPRAGSVAYGYFVNLLGAAEDGHRVVYAEGVFDEKAADALLATLTTDRRLRSILRRRAPHGARPARRGGEARLLELFGRLGRP